MQQVVQVERQDRRAFRFKFWGFVGVITVIFCTVLYLLYDAAYTSGTFDMFELFTQDWEIISIYWKDSLLAIFEEIDPDMVRIAIFCVIVFCIGILLTRKSRARIKNVEKEVEKLENTQSRVKGAL